MEMKEPFTKISNEYLEALARIRIPGEARQMLDVIIRQTNGFHKKAEGISTSQFMSQTGLSRHAIYKARNKLKEMNLIEVFSDEGSQVLRYALQEDSTQWKVSAKKEMVKTADKDACLQKGRLSVSQKADTPSPKKETTSLKERFKENLNKEEYIKHTLVNDVRTLDIFGNENSKTEEVLEPEIITKKERRLTNIQKLVEHYKRLEGYENDPEWDRKNFPIYVKPAKQLLDVCNDDVEYAVKAMTEIHAFCESEGLSCTLSTVTKMLDRWKNGKLVKNKKMSIEEKNILNLKQSLLKGGYSEQLDT